MAWRKLLLEATKYMYIMDDYGYLKAESLSGLYASVSKLKFKLI